MARRPLTLLFFCFASVVLLACGDDDHGASPSDGGVDYVLHDPPSWGDGSVVEAGPDALAPVFCPPARSNEPLPARAQVTSSTAVAGDRPVFTRDLYSSFESFCGACHVETALGGFEGQRINFDNFPDLIAQEALDRIMTEDLELVMPKPVAGGKQWSLRTPDDPVYQFAMLLQAWLDAGRPRDLFWIAGEATDGGSAYVFPVDLATNLTNIGNCIPEANVVGTETDRSAELDAFFEQTTELPLELTETDLTTFDSATLARYGIIAFAPQYPLWSDDAGKIRHIRVPRGQSIHFDGARQEFDIPPNTRFYKTFLKPVIDSEGNERFRKIETRLIVSRPDDCSVTPCRATALMGAYIWNEEETSATLLAEPLRSGEPFRDKMLTYVTDEVRAAEVRDQPGELAQVTRHYAVPGKDRCIQCHMGSSSASFVLGFTPLQVNMRAYVAEADLSAPAAELQGHGVLAESAPGEDELTQLERLIAYGIVTGMTSPSEVKSLKDSQDVPPRNGYELQAQAYLLGNCAHCHNPRGFPTITNPELLDRLDFYPDADGGIFGFPLDRTSPRIRRGIDADIDIPYITPSLYDIECTNGCTQALHYAAKYVTTLDGRGRIYVKAPWRSLVYRNVETPFTYTDHFAMFPHMPLNTPGFDCRAPRILGDWMVSMPARLRDPSVDEATNVDVQPYVEVLPSEAGFADAVTAARDRLVQYHDGFRYDYCPEGSDIQDPEVLSGRYLTPYDYGYMVDGNPFVTWPDNVPDRPHWFVTDPTETPGDWTPRRPDWADILIRDNRLLPENQDKVLAMSDTERAVVELIESADIRLTQELRSFALAEQPFGFWLNDQGACDSILQSQPTITSLETSGAPLPLWAETPAAQLRPADPIYSLAPGPAVFTNICINCHGPEGNGQSNLASTILNITGGDTRVANLRDGILGPASAPGTARERVFGAAATQLGIQPDDMAVRYLIWMGLGGTQRVIPPEALINVGNTRILGEVRNWAQPPEISANMLQTARRICLSALPEPGTHFGSVNFIDIVTGPDHGATSLIEQNGDAEMWERLCTFGQKAPVRVLQTPWDSPSRRFFIASVDGGRYALYDADAYGARPVMTRQGIVTGVSTGEPFPWCILRPTDPAELAIAQAFLSQPENLVSGQPVPFCPNPDELSPPLTWAEMLLTAEERDQWALRGAMNAGMAVFVYLDAIAKGQTKPKLQFNQCQSLSAN